MYQAIHTKFHGPTNTRPARVSARADAGAITLSWDHALGVHDNHKAAAVALARRYGWPEDMVGGSLPGSGYAFVCNREPPALLAALRDAEATISALYDDLVGATGGDFEVRENTNDTLNVVRAAIRAATQGE